MKKIILSIAIFTLIGAGALPLETKAATTDAAGTIDPGTNNGSGVYANYPTNTQSYNSNTNYNNVTGAYTLPDSVTAGNAAAASINQPAANSQAASAQNTTQSNVSGSGSMTGAVGSCVGSILGQAVARAATGLVGKAIGTVTDKVANPLVPDQPVNLEAAKIGIVIFGVPTGISWDSIQYCFINAMITYITQSTIAWINSGFNGNPAFVSNPQQFFSDIADQQAGAFVQQVVGGTTGLNICQPFRVGVGIGLAKQYGSTFAQRSQCTLTQASANVNQFLNGNWSQGGGYKSWISMTQNPQNNPYGLSLMSNNEMYARIGTQQNTAQLQLGLNKGWLNIQQCDKSAADDPERKSCHTTTPGGMIADAAAKQTGLAADRLVLANSFDQVVTALVNQLIKISLNKILQN
ncbi:MAG: hypothetical protein PHF79_01100 [Candidatus Pacebacteria bacterium]|nr:hypothetical protein [Candidatus Paceibacterota bacterium]